MRWSYVDIPSADPGQPVVLPEHYTALCAAHKLWLLSPAQLNIPLLCARPEEESLGFTLWLLRDPLIRLDQFVVPLRPGAYSAGPDALDRVVPHPGETVALATLVEYAVAAYGRECLPTLLAGLGQSDSWKTLVPAVFGVSVVEFEAGWQAYLAAQYGVPLSLSVTTTQDEKREHSDR